MPQLTPEIRKALRRLQADKIMTKRELAKYIGVSEKTAQSLTRDNEPLNVKTSVLNKVMIAIAKNY